MITDNMHFSSNFVFQFSVLTVTISHASSMF